MANITTLDLGPVRQVYKGEYSPAVPYDLLNTVFYQGESWVMIKTPYMAGTTPAIDSPYWQKIAVKGLDGKDGKNGTDGKDGEQGIQGIQGVIGPKGDKGATGAKGDKGDTGIQGPKGDKGDQGPAGEGASVDVSTLIPKTGDRGVLGGYEQATVYDDGVPDAITCNSADSLNIWVGDDMSTLTFVHPKGITTSACKIIRLVAVGDCTLNIQGATWVNNDDAPTWGTRGSVLILVAYFSPTDLVSYGSSSVFLSVLHNNEG